MQMALRGFRYLVVVAACGACCGTPVCAQELPKASDLMDKYIKVTGGKAAHEKVKSQVVKGTMSFMGIKGDMVAYQKAPNLMFMEITLPGIGTISTGYNGKVAWENNPLTGAKIFKGTKQEEMIREAAINSDGEWRKFYKNAKTAEEVQVDGKPAYRVELTSNSGTVSSRYFDKASGLLVKMKVKTDTDLGQLEVEMTVSDYKEFAGVKTPTRSRQSVAGQTIDTVITSVETNVNIPDSRFALPKEVQDLMKKT
jgi:outer membrane lipoprotein-sorting protein